MSEVQKTYSPIDGSVVAEHPLADAAELERVLSTSEHAATGWARASLEERLRHVEAFVEALLAQRDAAAEELTMQMGRPCTQTPGELSGFEERARAMIALAPAALRPIDPGPKEGFRRRISREPLGVVLLLAPWNYPWLTAVNALVPALLAGNTVVLKHSDQTPGVAERMAAAATATLPEGVVQRIHMSHARVAQAVSDRRVGHVAFTGSVAGGLAVQQATVGRFLGIGYELGGKDAAYVAEDALFDFSVENLVDGAYYNAGQSCCGVERIYVHRARYEAFVEAFVAEAKKLTLGDPREASTTLGPVVRVRNAEAIRAQIDAAVGAGARALLPSSERPLPYLAPQVLTGVTHEMAIMREETFGPVVGIMPVEGDDEALARMNDSRYGLTGSLWTADIERAKRMGSRLEVGTVFMNRCDNLDPELAWVGVRDSGWGATLSSLGFDHVTRPKSWHLRLPPS